MQLRDALRRPSFGIWQGILRETLKCYSTHRHLLVVPELFDWYFAPSTGQKLRPQPVVGQAIEPLIALRNEAHHPGIPAERLPEKITRGLHWLEQLLAGLQFLSAYPLAFIQEIRVRHPLPNTRRFSHDLLQMTGCYSIFDQQRWESDLDLQRERVVLLSPEVHGRSLFLDPFVIVEDRLPRREVFDVFLLNGTESRRARYVSVQFVEILPTDQVAPPWPKGPAHLEALARFFDLLRRAPLAEVEVEIEGVAQTLPALAEEHASRSTEEVFAARYRSEAPAKHYVSPYKFLDYFEPEDADLFFGRDQEIRQLLRKFYAARLLIVHGELGTGKTSLIRAGLIPQAARRELCARLRALLEGARAGYQRGGRAPAGSGCTPPRTAVGGVLGRRDSAFE
jgi:hypothetical protein